jgi:hypothetical protein
MLFFSARVRFVTSNDATPPGHVSERGRHNVTSGHTRCHPLSCLPIDTAAVAHAPSEYTGSEEGSHVRTFQQRRRREKPRVQRLVAVTFHIVPQERCVVVYRQMRRVFGRRDVTEPDASQAARQHMDATGRDSTGSDKRGHDSTCSPLLNELVVVQLRLCVELVVSRRTAIRCRRDPVGESVAITATAAANLLCLECEVRRLAVCHLQ